MNGWISAMARHLVLAFLTIIFINSAIALEEINKSCEEGKENLFLIDVISKMKNGENICYDNKILKGDLDFRQLNLTSRSSAHESKEQLNHNSVFPYEISITNSTIEGKLFAKDISFLESVNFKNTTFIGEVSFENSEFKKGIDLSNADFKNTVIFSQSSFSGDFICRNASFILPNFDEAEFNCTSIILSKSTFFSASFKDARFLGSDLYFDESKFKGGTDFSRTEFHTFTTFMSSEFKEDTFFNDAKFLGYVFFNKAIFYGPAEYSYTLFNSSAYFEKSQFRNYAFFRNTTFNGDVEFDESGFSNSAFFEEALFYNSVSLVQAHYEKFYARWNSLEDRLKYNDEVYLSLIANYKNVGWFEDANNCYYKYRIEYARQTYDLSLPPISELTNHPRNYIIKWYSLLLKVLYKITDYLFMVINGYGVKPSRPLILMLFIIPAFGLFYWKADNISFCSAMKFSIVVFLSGSGKLFVEAPDYKPRSSSHLATLSIVAFYLERIAGMVIFIALLVAFSKTVLR
jgi:uncharacterized protein YjbI with pentapeptide repeats